LPAKLLDRDGRVTISVIVGSDGKIRDPRVDYASNAAFAEPCLTALQKWEFSPAVSRSGEPVAMRLSIPFVFKAVTPPTGG